MSLGLARGRCMAGVGRRRSLRACGLQPRAQIVWVKQHFTLSRGHYHWRHEKLLVNAVRRAKAGNWQGDRKQNTVWENRNNNPVG